MLFHKYILYGKSNEEKLRFGESPIKQYNNLSSNIENQRASHIIKSIQSNLIQLGKYIETLPVFFCVTPKEKMKGGGGDTSHVVCNTCGEMFSNFQGLGGHRAKKHPSQSLNYKTKRELYEKRKPLRAIHTNAKRKLCQIHQLDFDYLNQTKEGKEMIKKVMNKNYKEFKKIKKEMKKSSKVEINNLS